MNCVVEFQIDRAENRRGKLVYPGDADIAKGFLSILSPIGTALIGLAAGQSIRWSGHDGRPHELTVLAVEPPVQD
jgi:regulator of nucleoside diphosphate kinase